jgi:hypothetical protein
VTPLSTGDEGRERLAVSKQTALNIRVESFNLEKLDEEGKEQRGVVISNRFGGLVNLRR